MNAPRSYREANDLAAMLESLPRFMRARRTHAIVSTFEDNVAGIRLYESLGFQVVHQLGSYEKDV